MCGMALFTADINGWTNWGNMFQSIPAFAPLVEHIYQISGLDMDAPIENLTPGSNAVFKRADTVIKVFAPPQTGIADDYGFITERFALQHAQNVGVRVPKVLASGTVQDSYRFDYIIMEYIAGQEAGAVLHTMDKGKFAAEMRTILQKLNVRTELFRPVDLRKQAINNHRLRALHPQLVLQLQAHVAAQTWQTEVFVHGDVTGDNVLINDAGEIVLIDFADCYLAPAYYELPPLIFELFTEDTMLATAYLSKAPTPEFIEDLIAGIFLHDFGADVLHGFFMRKGLDVRTVTSVDMLRDYLHQHFIG